MNKLADEKLLDETVVYYMSDHGLTLGENGVMGKDGARAQWHIYHVPGADPAPGGRLAGQTSDYFASTHDVPRTLLSFMGVRAPGMMEGEDLSVLFEGREPPARPYFTSCYDNYLLCGDGDWFLLSDSEGGASACTTSATTPRRCTTSPPSTPRSSTGSGGCSRTRRRDPAAVRVVGREVIGVTSPGAPLPPRGDRGRRPARGHVIARRARRPLRRGTRGERAPVVLRCWCAGLREGVQGTSGTDTPNLNELTGNSLRFDRVVPSACPRCRCGARS